MPWSRPVIHSDLQSDPPDIDAPADLRATDVTLDSAVLTWIPPFADFEGYILTYRDEDGNMEVLTHSHSHTFAHPNRQPTKGVKILIFQDELHTFSGTASITHALRECWSKTLQKSKNLDFFFRHVFQHIIITAITGVKYRNKLGQDFHGVCLFLKKFN